MGIRGSIKYQLMTLFAAIAACENVDLFYPVSLLPYLTINKQTHFRENLLTARRRSLYHEAIETE